MSFLECAKQAADLARQSASDGITAMATPEAKAEMREAASQVGMHARGAAGQSSERETRPTSRTESVAEARA